MQPVTQKIIYYEEVCKMNDPVVIDVAYFAETPEIRDAMLLSSKIRAETLKRCYAMPGYENLPHDEKLKTYDSINAQVAKELS
jgi:hypothetical protein